jgi:hypothetical protein
VDIFEYVSWYIHLCKYMGLATTTVEGTTIVSIKLNIGKGNNQTRI